MNEHIATIVGEIHDYLYERYAEDVKRASHDEETKKIKNLYRDVFGALKHGREEYYRKMDLSMPEY